MRLSYTCANAQVDVAVQFSGYSWERTFVTSHCSLLQEGCCECFEMCKVWRKKGEGWTSQHFSIHFTTWKSNEPQRHTHSEELPNVCTVPTIWVLYQVREGVVGVGGLVEGTSRGIGGLVEGTGRGIGKGFGSILGGRREEGRGGPPPTLDRLLSKESLTGKEKPAKRPPRFVFSW